MKLLIEVEIEDYGLIQSNLKDVVAAATKKASQLIEGRNFFANHGDDEYTFGRVVSADLITKDTHEKVSA